MRVLLLAPSLPDPTDASPANTTLQTVHCLAREHEVLLFARGRGAVDLHALHALLDLCERVEVAPIGDNLPRAAANFAASMATGRPIALNRGDVAATREAVGRLLRAERIDVIHVADISMARFVPAFWAGPIVLDERGLSWRTIARRAQSEGNAPLHWLLEREARLLREAEVAACRRATVTLVGNGIERAAIEEAIGATWSVHVVPVGIDVTKWDDTWDRRDPLRGQALTVLHRGDEHESEAASWLLRHVFPRVRAQLPTARYEVAAPRHGRDLRLLAVEQEGVGLRTLGAAPAPVWDRADVYLAPPLRDGQAHAGIIEAFAAGVPVVTPSIASEGLEVVHYQHALIADTPSEIADAVRHIAEEPRLAHQLVAQGRRLAGDRYDVAYSHANLGAAYKHIQVGVTRCVLCS